MSTSADDSTNDTGSTLTEDEWKERLAPVLPVSLREASDRMTQAAPVQKWLHSASFEAAEGLTQMPPTQAEAEGYWRMMDALADRFPELLRAVESLTDGCAAVDLHWRPLSPSFTRIYLRPTDDRDSDVLIRLDGCAETDVREALQTLSKALPKGKPFPNRPHEATGTMVFDGQCLTVRLREHVGEEETRRLSILLLRGEASSDPLPFDNAVRHIHAFFQTTR